jgi:hypothetical protein
MATFVSPSEQANQILKDYFLNSIMPPEATSIPGNEWMKQSTQMSNALLYANGRFQGLLPGLSPEDGYGGHPGLIYKLIICALCYGIGCIGISVSGKQDNDKNPLAYEDKLPIILSIIETLKSNVIKNIETYIKHYLTKEIKQEIQKRLVVLRIEIRQLTNPFSMVLTFKNEIFGITDGATLIMASGLEGTKTGEKNKYENTFKSLTGQEKPFASVGFILTSRKEHISKSDTMSGTYIRGLISQRKYKEIAMYLLDAGFTSTELLTLYGRLIKEMRGEQASQTDEEYKDELEDAINEASQAIIKEDDEEMQESEQASQKFIESQQASQEQPLKKPRNGGRKTNTRKSRRTNRRKSKQTNRLKSRRH